MFKTLYAKFAAILLGLFIVIGLLYIILTLFTTRLYIQEGAQRLNYQLAEYLVSQKFFIQEGKINEEALRESFDMLMHINHNIEVYLLDPEGKILSYSAPPGKVKGDVVALGPLKQFLKGTDHLPILGDDPRSPGRKKAFSVSPVPLQGPLEGYLYIILGGEKYDSIFKMLQGNYILRLSMWVAIAALIFVLMTGLFLFNVLTRRLSRLTSDMENFKKSDFNKPVKITSRSERGSGDEIGLLGQVFEQMSDRIIHQMNKIRQSDNLRRELVSNVSHDLRTPLTSLQGYLETLHLKGHEMVPEEKERYLKTAIKHSERLGKLVHELFELAKLDAQETPPKAEPFHLGELVQDIVQKFQFHAEKRKVKLQTEFPENLPFVFGDLGMIERAIQNLIDNALRYTKEGGTVTMSLRPEVSMVTVQVMDDGYGINKEHIPYIFDRFYRVQEQDREDSDSAGLGLAITKRIIELHGSHIEVLSELNAGTTFTFQLPVYRTEA